MTIGLYHTIHILSFISSIQLINTKIVMPWEEGGSVFSLLFLSRIKEIPALSAPVNHLEISL